MINLKLYRKRIIPNEILLLKDDEIIKNDENVIITKWNTINPKSTFDHGSSCYFLKEGIKVSKFYRPDNSLLFWYCDICQYEFLPEDNAMICTDLLADVIVYPDGRYKVMDLDELAEAARKELITTEQLTTSLENLHYLLTLIYRDKFDHVQAPLNELGL